MQGRGIVTRNDTEMIGPLTRKQRLAKVCSYLFKKRARLDRKDSDVKYHCRKKVATQRLRIKGRFMTKKQALELLGLTQDELLENADI